MSTPHGHFFTRFHFNLKVSLLVLIRITWYILPLLVMKIYFTTKTFPFVKFWFNIISYLTFEKKGAHINYIADH